MTRQLNVGIIQSAFSDDMEENIATIVGHIRHAAKQGADVVLPPELFQGYYFCKTQEEKEFSRAYIWNEHPCVITLAQIAKELEIVIPVSIYEKSGPHYFNSVVMIDADGELLGVYRKTHIPDGPGYQEKFYFKPGDTGFKVWNTAKGRLGVGICWDQWFPECARAMALAGADFIALSNGDWIRTTRTKYGYGCAMASRDARACCCNVIPIAASNRVGTEQGQSFYGTSFICDAVGDIVEDMNREEEGFVSRVSI